MFKPKFYYDPAPEGGGNGNIKVEEVKEVKNPQEAVSFDKVDGDIFAKILEQPVVEEEKKEEVVKTPEQIAAEKTEKITKFGLKEGATDQEIADAEKEFLSKEENKTPEIKAAERKEKIAKLNLKEDASDDDIKAAEEAADNDAELKLDEGDDHKKGDEDNSWVATAKEFGFEIKTDSFEEFKAAIIKDKQDAIAAERQKQYELSVKDYTPQAQEFIKFLDNKGTVEDFIAPLKVYDEALALSDEELVRIDLKYKKWDDEKITEQIEILKEASTLEQTGYALRKQIETNKENKSKQIIAAQELKFKASETQRLEAERKENESIKAIIDKTDEFFGGKLSKETKEALFKKHLRGDYRKRLESSPEDAVKTMLFLEFGEKQFKQIKKDVLQRGKETILNKLHNTKGEEKAGTRTPATGKSFEAWDVIMNPENQQQ